MTNRRWGMHREEIKAAIRMSGATLVRLSKQWGYAHNAISVTLERPWPEVEARIAEYLGKAPQDIWPSRYLPNGMPNRLRLVSVRKNSSPITCRNNQLKDAA